MAKANCIPLVTLECKELIDYHRTDIYQHKIGQ